MGAIYSVWVTEITCGVYKKFVVCKLGLYNKGCQCNKQNEIRFDKYLQHVQNTLSTTPSPTCVCSLPIAQECGMSLCMNYRCTWQCFQNVQQLPPTYSRKPSFEIDVDQIFLWHFRVHVKKTLPYKKLFGLTTVVPNALCSFSLCCGVLYKVFNGNVSYFFLNRISLIVHQAY